MAMAGQSLAGKPWTEFEIELIVADYFDMLNKQLRHEEYSKVEHKRRLAANLGTGRHWRALDPKYQNVSAVLEQLGYPIVEGYKPRPNFQQQLFLGIERFLSGTEDPLKDLDVVNTNGPGSLKFEEPPELREAPADNRELHRLIRKFDPALRDERNRKLGELGEERVYKHEQDRLVGCGRKDLAQQVCWISRDHGDGAGFDILSFDVTGEKRFLEVKTTLGYRSTPFYLTRNELSFSEENPDNFRIVRLYDFARNARAFELKPPINESVSLDPLVYQATFG